MFQFFTCARRVSWIIPWATFRISWIMSLTTFKAKEHFLICDPKFLFSPLPVYFFFFALYKFFHKASLFIKKQEKLWKVSMIFAVILQSAAASDCIPSVAVIPLLPVKFLTSTACSNTCCIFCTWSQWADIWEPCSRLTISALVLWHEHRVSIVRANRIQTI